MKRLAATTIFLVFVALTCSHPVNAQNDKPWVEFSPADELFRVSMPQEPETEDQQDTYGEPSVSGKRYSTLVDGASYTVWSLENINYRPVPSATTDDYLDSCSDLFWEALLKPARRKLPEHPSGLGVMAYVKELAAKPLPGREYSITIAEITGTVQFYVGGARIYALLATNSPGGPWERERFFESFAMKPGVPAPLLALVPNATGTAASAEQGDSDSNQVFEVRETTEKVRITAKPEPSYTESARKFRVVGTIVLRAVFSKEGRVTNIQVLRKLPHGLTNAAIVAAQHIEFIPATKDGHPGSQYFQLEYNFNLY